MGVVQVGYLCPGTCLGWMYDQLKARWSYGFEVFDGYDGFTRVKNGGVLLETEAESGALRAAPTATAAPTNSSLWPAPATDRAKHCLKQFNPTTKDSFQKTITH